MLTKMGIDPKMSMMAAITMKELKISIKLIFPNIKLSVFRFPFSVYTWLQR